MKKCRKKIAILQVIAMLITFIAPGFNYDIGKSIPRNVKAETVSANKVTINPQLAYQTWEGWGTSLCWWANAIGDFKSLPATKEGVEKGYSNRYEELMDLIFGTENGLGLNIVRYNIGGGDDESKNFINREGSKVPGYLSNDGTYNWDADKNQVQVLKDAYKMIQDSGQTFYNQVFSNSPPYFMTYSGSSTGGKPSTKDQLKWDKYEEFADYLLDVTNYLVKEVGVPVNDIEPVNEPTSGYWEFGSQKQEGAQFNMDPQPETHIKNYNAAKDTYDPNKYSAQDKIYEILGDKLAERQKNGQLIGLQITGTDETSIDVAKKAFLKLTDRAKNNIYKISTHEYSGSDRIGLYNTAASYDKVLWQSEVGFGGGAPSADAMDSGSFEVSKAISQDMNDMRASAWIGWQVIDSLGECIAWNGNWGFLVCAFEDACWKTGTTIDWNGKRVDASNTSDHGISMKYYDKRSNPSVLVTPELYKERGIDRGYYYATKKYYVLGQYSRYIKEGYQIIEVSDDNYVAALSPDKKQLVFVVSNDSTDAKDYSVDLKNICNIGSINAVRTSATEKWEKVSSYGTLSGNTLNITAEPESVTTYIVDATDGNKLKTDDVNGHYVSAGVKKVALSVDGIDKFDYSGKWLDVSDASSYQGYVSQSTTVGDIATFEFEGSVGSIYGGMSTSGGMMAISVDGGNEQFIDTYSIVTKSDKKLFTTGVLEDGIHTITIRNAANKNVLSDGNKIVLSRALSANGVLSVDDTISITTYAAMQGRITLEFTELDDVNSYTVKYGFVSGDYTFSNTNIDGSPYVIDNLAPGVTYYVVVTTNKDGVEIVSNEITATPKAGDSNVLYYVNCGAPTGDDTGDPTEKLGMYNSVADQAFSKDAVTNMAWGYDASRGTWARETAGDKWDSLRCDTSDEAGGMIQYSFEIPNGSYEVSVGIYDPWCNYNRKTDLIINSEVIKQGFVAGKDKLTETNIIEVTNGRIDIGVARSEGIIASELDPQVSWIRISKVVTDNIKAVQAFDIVEIPIGTIPSLPTHATVTYNDDSTGTLPITWENISSDMFTEGFKLVTLTGKLPDSSKTVAYTVKPMPSEYKYIMDLGRNKDGTTTSKFIDKLVKDTGSKLLNDKREQKSDGTTWGWLPNSNDNSDLEPYDSDDEFNSLRYSNDSTKRLDTIFPIENGTYDIAIGTKNPWGEWGRGDNDFIVEGVTVLKENIPASAAIHVINNVEVSDGILNVSLQGYKDAAIMSWIAIYPHYQSVNTLAFTQTGYLVEKDNTYTLPYTVTPSSTTVSFTSSDESVVTVDSTDGKVTAVGYGFATITALAGDAMASCVIIVPPNASEITADASTTVGYGKTAIVSFTVEPENAKDKNLTITSTDSSKVAIKSTQRIGSTTYVTLKAVGNVDDTADIKAVLGSDSTITKTMTVSIVDVPVSGIKLDKSLVSLAVNEGSSIVDDPTDGEGFVCKGIVKASFLVDGEVHGLNRTVEWAIKSGSDVISITPNGNEVTISSKRVGSAVVIAKIETLPGSNEYIEKEVAVTVTADPLVIKSVDTLDEIIVQAGNIPELPRTVRVYYTNGSYADVNIIWNTYNQDLIYTLGNFDITGVIRGTTIDVTVTIKVEKKNIANTTISGIDSAVYKGNPVTLPIIITNGTKKLVEGTDYTVTYTDNNRVGEAKVVITGINSYFGMTTFNFTIHQYVTPTEQTQSVSPVIISIAISKLPNKVNYIEGQELDTSGLELIVNYSNGKSEIISSGYTVSTTALDSVGTNTIIIDYKNKSTTFDITVLAKKIKKVSIASKPKQLVYVVGDKLTTNGLSLKIAYDNGKSEVITTGYTVNEVKMKTPGVKEVIVTYKKKTVTFTIAVLPKKVTGVKVKSVKAGMATLTWEKQSGVSGYQVYRATSKNGKYSKVATISYKKTTYTAMNLSDSQTYYFKVRSYKLVNGVKKYGKYSETIIAK